MSRPDSHSAAPPRRAFFTQAGAGVALLALAPGVRLVELALARSDDEPVTSANRWGLLIDTDKCQSGCTECVSACNEEHGIVGHGRPETDAQWIRKVDLKDDQTGHELSIPVLCQHCEEPPCVDVCPTGASFRRNDGIVLVDKHICIGCRYCMMACPFQARSFIHEDLSGQLTHAPRGKGVVESCTLCVHRIDKGEQPACVEACHKEGHHALVFGDLKDSDSELATLNSTVATRELRPELALKTSVRYTSF